MGGYPSCNQLVLFPQPGNYEEVHGDLYDRRTGKRLRTGYREVFYQITDGHQLRATLRFLEDAVEGRRFVCITDEGGAICKRCIRSMLRDLLYGMRHPRSCLLRVVATEPRYSEPLRCECCDDDIPPIEDRL